MVTIMTHSSIPVLLITGLMLNAANDAIAQR